MIGNFPLEIFELCFKRLECVHVSYWRQEGFYRKGARKRKALPPTHDLEILWMTSWCHAESGLLLWGGRHKSQSKSIILLRTVCVITFSLNPQFNRKPEYHDTNGEIGSFLKAHARSLPAIWMNKKRIYKFYTHFSVSVCVMVPPILRRLYRICQKQCWKGSQGFWQWCWNLQTATIVTFGVQELQRYLCVISRLISLLCIKVFQKAANITKSYTPLQGRVWKLTQ